MSEFATPADILSQTERRYVDIMLNGKKVRFRSLTAAERLRVDAEPSLSVKSGLMIALTVCNEKGDLIFTESDIPQIINMDGQVFDAYRDIILSHCMNLKPIEELIDDAKKN